MQQTVAGQPGALSPAALATIVAAGDFEAFVRDALTSSPWIFPADIFDALTGVGLGVDVTTIVDGMHASQIVERHVMRTVGGLWLPTANRLGMAIIMLWNARAADAQRPGHRRAVA